MTPALFRHKNLVSVALAQAATASDTQLVLDAGGGARLPDPGERGAILGVYNSTDFTKAEDAMLAGALEFMLLTEVNVDGNPDKIEVERGFHSTAIQLDVEGKTYRIYQPLHEFTLDVIGYSMPFGILLGGAMCDGVSDDGPSINATCAMVPDSGGRVYIGPGDMRIGSNVTVPQNVTLCVSQGARLIIDDGTILTVEGQIEAGHYQIFWGEGEVVPAAQSVQWTNNLATQEFVRAAWWGVLPSATASPVDVTENIQNCWDSIGVPSEVSGVPTARVREIRYVGGTIHATALVCPDVVNSVCHRAPFRRTCTIKQLPTVDAGDPLIVTGSDDQRGPVFLNFEFIGDPNGGDIVDVSNTQETHFENCQFTNGAATRAQLRIHNGTTRTTIVRCRFHNTSTSHADYGLWVGDVADEFPQTTNNYCYNISSYGLGSDQGFDAGTFLFLDNAGGFHVYDSKLDGLQCERNVYIKGGLSFRFVNSFFEMTGNHDIDFEIEDASFIWFERVALGHPSQKPVALKITDSYMIRFRSCYIQGEINCENDGGEPVDDVKFQDCELGDNVTWTGDVNAGGEPGHPFVTVEDCVTVNSNREVTGSYFGGPDTFAKLLKVGVDPGATLLAERDLQVSGELSSTGNISITGLWDEAHIVLGGVHIFINGNDVRASVGAPTSATDGVLVVTAT